MQDNGSKTNSFYFRQRYGRLDWRKVAKVNVEEVIREVDLSVLQQLLDEVTFSQVTTDDLPPGGEELTVKLVRLSQLMIEYLLHVQTCQEQGSHKLVKQLSSAHSAVASLKSDLDLSTKDCRALRRETLQYQGVVATCQKLLRQYGIDATPLLTQLHHQSTTGLPPFSFVEPRPEEGSGNFPAPASTIPPPNSAPPVVSAHVCGSCGKVFSSGNFLEKHTAKRHASEARSNASPTKVSPPPPGDQDEDEAAVREGARRLSEMVAARKADEISALKAQIDELRALLSKQSAPIPPNITQTENIVIDPPPLIRGKERAQRLVSVRRFCQKLGKSGTHAIVRWGFSHWRSVLIEMKPKLIAEVAAPAPVRDPHQQLLGIMAALRRRVDLAVEAQCGPECGDRGEGEEGSNVYEVPTGSGNVLHSCWKLGPEEVEEARKEVEKELRNRCESAGLDPQNKRLDNDNYNRRVAELSVRRGRLLPSEVSHELHRTEEEVDAITKKFIPQTSPRYIDRASHSIPPRGYTEEKDPHGSPHGYWGPGSAVNLPMTSGVNLPMASVVSLAMTSASAEEAAAIARRGKEISEEAIRRRSSLLQTQQFDPTSVAQHTSQGSHTPPPAGGVGGYGSVLPHQQVPIGTNAISNAPTNTYNSTTYNSNATGGVNSNRRDSAPAGAGAIPPPSPQAVPIQRERVSIPGQKVQQGSSTGVSGTAASAGVTVLDAPVSIRSTAPPRKPSPLAPKQRDSITQINNMSNAGINTHLHSSGLTSSSGTVTASNLIGQSSGVSSQRVPSFSSGKTTLESGPSGTAKNIAKNIPQDAPNVPQEPQNAPEKSQSNIATSASRTASRRSSLDNTNVNNAAGTTPVHAQVTDTLSGAASILSDTSSPVTSARVWSTEQVPTHTKDSKNSSSNNVLQHSDVHTATNTGMHTDRNRPSDVDVVSEEVQLFGETDDENEKEANKNSQRRAAVSRLTALQASTPTVLSNVSTPDVGTFSFGQPTNTPLGEHRASSAMFDNSVSPRNDRISSFSPQKDSGSDWDSDSNASSKLPISTRNLRDAHNSGIGSKEHEQPEGIAGRGSLRMTSSPISPPPKTASLAVEDIDESMEIEEFSL